MEPAVTGNRAGMTELDAAPPAVPALVEHQRTIELPGRGRMRAIDVSGPPGAPALLLLHGWTSTALVNWFNVISSAARHFRVVAPDLRGHGGGGWTGPVTLERCADDLASLARRLDLDEVIVAGYSLGGAVAQLTWRRHRSLVRGLVLCSSALEFRSTPVEWLRHIGLCIGTGLARPLPDRFSRDVALMIFDRLYGSEGLQGWINQQVAGLDWPAVLALGSALGRFDSSPWAEAIDVPAASVVTVDDDHVTPIRQLRLARAAGASIHPVAGDHAACLSDPGRYVPPFVEACLDVAGRAVTRRARSGESAPRCA